MFVPFAVVNRYCTECKRETKQRTFIVRPLFALLLAILTLGSFLLVWAASCFSRGTTFCCRCGHENRRFSPNRRGVVRGP
jgi:hypothetical protein